MRFILENYEKASYEDDNTLYVAGESPNEIVVKSLEEESIGLFNWFRVNQLQGNAGKCHSLLSNEETYKLRTVSFQV